MGLYSCLLSMLPHYDWWVWNVLEILLRAWGICLSVPCMLMSGMLSDSGGDFAVFLAMTMMLNFLLLTVALVIRHWKLGVITVSIPMFWILVCLGFASGPIGFIVLVILLALECFFHPARSIYASAFAGQGPLQAMDASNGMRGYTPLDPSSPSCESQVAMV
jgi:hypothetical protein